jgi:hypothetical protein
MTSDWASEGTGPAGATSAGDAPVEEAVARPGPISGRYYGAMTRPRVGHYALDLRVDIDPCRPHSPVLRRISGDVYQVYRWPRAGGTATWRTYRESWVVDDPLVTWGASSVTITGRVHFWRGTHPAADIEVVIPWTATQVGPASATFTSADGTQRAYTCPRVSDTFRDVTLEVDVCASVNAPPLLPGYDTHAHPNRPADLAKRELTIETAYAEAGVKLTVNPVHTVVADDAPEFDSWSAAELHDAMESHFSQYRGVWPKWHLWCLVAGAFENAAVGGIMFDVAAAFGGAGVPPERQGCAVFRRHEWFRDLVAAPASEAQAAAARKYLYTFVHEIGHAFNLLHSWDKGRPDAESWMNYDWRYDRRNGTGRFWSRFQMRFDDEELLHLRHGDRAAVIMGADPWATGTHAEAPSGAFVELIGEAPFELLLRSKGYFHFMEPVIVELRIRNVGSEPIEADTELNPEFGGVVIYVRRPSGEIVQYAPVMCKQASPSLRMLKPTGDGVEGEDRYSQNVFLSYGSAGFCVGDPGEYLVRAVYLGAGDVEIPSNLLRLRVGTPSSREDERIAQDYFTYETGMALYLGGSASPFLAKGMEVLQTVAQRYEQSAVGAHVSLVLGQSLAEPFFRLVDGKVVKAREADPQTALEWATRALEQQQRDSSTFTNITYHQLRRTRAGLLADMGEPAEARKELRTLVRELAQRGVNQPVLDEIRAYAKSL